MEFIKTVLNGFLGIKKDPNATTQDVAVIKAEDTNSGIAIVPNGTGAFTLQVPDGTSTGVNVGDVITQSNAFAFKKIGGTSSIVGSVTDLATHSDSGMSTASMGYSAGASQELALTFTAPTFSGGGSVTLRIVNKIMLTEVAY